MVSLNWKESVLSELLYADNSVLMSDTIEGLRNKVRKRKKPLENVGLKVNLGKPKAMVSESITKEGFSKN